MEAVPDIHMLNSLIDRLYEQVEEEQEAMFRNANKDESEIHRKKIENLIKEIKRRENELSRLETGS